MTRAISCHMLAPCVSIALPVYNGGHLVTQAIESILTQSFSNFELLIADNASTDDTESICRSYAACDPRVRYFRHAANIGAGRNFNFLFHHARGRYFKWAAHDDLLEHEYLARCVDVLNRDPSVSLVHTDVRYIDEQGNEIDRFTLDRTFAASTRLARFRAVIDAYDFSAIWGVMRRAQVSRTNLIPLYCGSDRLFLAEMALRGRVVIVPECLFSWRMYNGCYRRNNMSVKSQRWLWWDPSKRAWPMRLTLSRLAHGAAIVTRVPMSMHERAACMAAITSWTAKPLLRKFARARTTQQPLPSQRNDTVSNLTP